MNEQYNEILRNLRGNKTLEEVASAIGITRSALCSYEKGTRIPRDKYKIRIAKYYGKTVQEIFFAE